MCVYIYQDQSLMRRLLEQCILWFDALQCDLMCCSALVCFVTCFLSLALCLALSLARPLSLCMCVCVCAYAQHLRRSLIFMSTANTQQPTHRHGTALQDVLQHTLRDTVQTATYCNTRQHTATLWHTANTLKHTAKHCNTLQHTATLCNSIHPEMRTYVLFLQR